MIKDLFKRDIESIEIGLSIIHLFNEEEFDDAQIGYRCNKNGEKITDWVGDNFYVIGHDSCCGDPILVDTSDNNLPIYSLFHDDWTQLDKIANSFKEYIDILKMIEKCDLKDEEENSKLLDNILEKAPKEGHDYWEALIVSSFEFLNDEE